MENYLYYYLKKYYMAVHNVNKTPWHTFNCYRIWKISTWNVRSIQQPEKYNEGNNDLAIGHLTYKNICRQFQKEKNQNYNDHRINNIENKCHKYLNIGRSIVADIYCMYSSKYHLSNDVSIFKHYRKIRVILLCLRLL